MLLRYFDKEQYVNLILILIQKFVLSTAFGVGSELLDFRSLKI